MNEYILSCESTADLSEERLAERSIPFACFSFHMDGKDYKDDYGHSMALETFYRKMEEGSVSTTSQVSVGEYEELWEPYLSQGKDIVHITLSSGISGTYNSAVLAADGLRGKYPEREIFVIDSLSASAGFGLLMEMAADKRDAGASAKELADYVLSIRDGINAWFYTGDLTYLCRGGRVSKTACVFGTALKICPLLRLNLEGKLVPYAKCRGKKKAREAVVERMLAMAENGRDYDGYCYISHSLCEDEANAARELIEENFPKLKGKIRFFYIGTVIGSHTGPGLVATFFYGKNKEE
ncbi:MAG: DegV family protein [Eubacteriales bacterium]|nr:DegV family protein [Eubacteriales bacterium]